MQRNSLAERLLQVVKALAIGTETTGYCMRLKYNSCRSQLSNVCAGSLTLILVLAVWSPRNVPVY